MDIQKGMKNKKRFIPFILIFGYKITVEIHAVHLFFVTDYKKLKIIFFLRQSVKSVLSVGNFGNLF